MAKKKAAKRKPAKIRTRTKASDINPLSAPLEWDVSCDFDGDWSYPQ